jgi:rhamnogalacturonan endolyase
MTDYYIDGAQTDIAFTDARIHSQDSEFTDIVFTAKAGEFHWILMPELAGAYQYFVNKALPDLGEFRSLWRLDNSSFTHGKTDERDEMLPSLADIHASTKTQDETWQRVDGSYITKYDFSTFMPSIEGQLSYWGVYGNLSGNSDLGGIGSWYIHGGKDYINGDHLKQELMVHRESQSGDTVQLNMIHGTHFQTSSSDSFPTNKIWGPWLWYLVSNPESES